MKRNRKEMHGRHGIHAEKRKKRERLRASRTSTDEWEIEETESDHMHIRNSINLGFFFLSVFSV